jgi:hypothetical protein
MRVGGRTDRKTDKHDEAVAVRSRSYYTYNCGTYSEFSVILMDGLRESEALGEHQDFPCSSLHGSFIKSHIFLYNLIRFGARTMLTSSLAINYHYFYYFESCLYFYHLTFQGDTPTLFLLVIGRTTKGVYFRWLTNLKF